MLTFLIGLAASSFLVHSRWGRPVQEIQVAGVAGFALPIAGAIFGGLGAGNLLIAFGADTGSALADLLVYAWGVAGAGAGFGAAWAATNWLLEDDASIEAGPSKPRRRPSAGFRRGGTTLDDLGDTYDVPDLDDVLPTGPMMPALAAVSASASGEFTPPSNITSIDFPF